MKPDKTKPIILNGQLVGYESLPPKKPIILDGKIVGFQ